MATDTLGFSPDNPFAAGLTKKREAGASAPAPSVPGFSPDNPFAPQLAASARVQVPEERGIFGEFVTGLGRGVRQTKDLASAGIGILTGDDEQVREAAQRMQDYEQEGVAPTIRGIEEIDSFGDFAQWTAGLIGEQVPTIAGALVSGGLGAFLTKKVAERVIKEEMKDQILDKAKKIGAGTGMVGYAGALETGGIGTEQVDAGVDIDNATAIGFGLAAGALEASPFMMLAKQFGLFGKEFTSDFMKHVMALPKGRRAAAIGALYGASEATTELGQESLAIAARNLVDENYDQLGEETASRLKNAAAAGFVAGGGVAGPLSLLQKRGQAPDPFEKVNREAEQRVASDTVQPTTTPPEKAAAAEGVELGAVNDPARRFELPDTWEDMSQQERDQWRLDKYNEIIGEAERLATDPAKVDEVTEQLLNRFSAGTGESFLFPYGPDPEDGPGLDGVNSQTRGSVTVYGNDQPGSLLTPTVETVANYAESLIKKFLPNVDIEILMPSALAETKRDSRDVPGANGWMYGYKRDPSLDVPTYRVGLQKNAFYNDTNWVDTLHHEIGHIFLQETARRAPKPVQEALSKQMAKWRHDLKTMKPTEWLLRFGSTHRIQTLQREATVAESLGKSAWDFIQDMGPQTAKWYLSPKEFFAEQIARVARGEKVETETVTREEKIAYNWFQKVWNRIKQMFGGTVQETRTWQETVENRSNAMDIEPITETLLRLLQYEQLTEQEMMAQAQAATVQAEVETTLDRDETERLPTAENLDIEHDGEGTDPYINNFQDRADTLVTKVGGDKLPRARFNWFIRMFANLLNIGELNQYVPGVGKYIEAVRNWWADKTQWTEMADRRLQEWAALNLSKEHREAFDQFLTELTLASDEAKRKLGPQDAKWQELWEKNKLPDSPELLKFIDGLKEDFDRSLQAVYEELIADAQRNITNVTDRNKKIAELNAELKTLLDRNYFPLQRFGQYWVKVKDRKSQTKILEYTLFETEKEALDYIRRMNKGDTVATGGKLTEMERSFIGMPKQLIQLMKGHLKLTAEQIEQLDGIVHAAAPGQSFRKHRLHRKGTAGFSQDGQRVYADYFLHFSNYISRVKHYQMLTEGLHDLDAHIQRLNRVPGVFSRKEQELRDYLDKHYKYAMDPGNELANLRSAGFLWYLGFMPKSALINLTQVPLVTYPYLAARYGDGATIKELNRALFDLRKLWARGEGLDETELVAAIEQGIKGGFLDESLATELAALAEGSNLQRMVPGSFLRSQRAAKFIRTASHYGAWMFQRAEKVNRLVTFAAAFRLARDAYLKKHGLKSVEQLSDTQHQQMREEAYKAARGAVEGSQFEYARWNRPQFMRGPQSVIFLFWNYLQNMLYFTARDPGAGRFLVIMLAMAGLQGLPGAEDMLDAVEFVLKKIGPSIGIDGMPDLRLQIREVVNELSGNPVWAETLMNGLSHKSFGLSHLGDMAGIPIPALDFSGSLSLGRIVPGVEPILGREGKFADRFAAASEDVGGAFVSIPMSILKAVVDDNPDQFKRWERALPSILRSGTRAYRYATTGQEVDSSGAEIVSFDPKNPEQLMEIVGQAMGAPVTRVRQMQELNWLKREHARYYQSRRTMLLSQMDYAIRSKDRPAQRDVREAIRRYNQSVPSPALRITRKAIRQSMRTRQQRRMLIERGLPTSRMDRQLYRQLEESFGVPSGEA